MTCVAAVVSGDTILAGADSAAGMGEEIYRLDEPKVFVREPYLLGYCGSLRIGQILRHRVELPEPPESEDLTPFLVRELVPAVRRAVEEEGAAGEGKAFLGEKTVILIGWRGKLWTLGTDLSIFPAGADFVAIGSGRPRSYGAFHALAAAGVEPARRRLELALEAAAAYTSNVRAPFHFVTLG